jgi:uncharacterized protein YjgD (DUF1641 family)
MDSAIILSSAQSLQKYFDDDIKASNYDQLKEWLTSEIVKLLLNDMEKLLNILYRIDVNEKKVKEVFAQNNPQMIAPILAELILQREIQKAVTREEFRNKD